MPRGGAYFTRNNVLPSTLVGVGTGLATRSPGWGLLAAAATPAVMNTLSGRPALQSRGGQIRAGRYSCTTDAMTGGSPFKCGMRGGRSQVSAGTYKCGMRGGRSPVSAGTYKCGMRGGRSPMGAGMYKCGMRGGYLGRTDGPLTGGRRRRSRTY